MWTKVNIIQLILAGIAGFGMVLGVALPSRLLFLCGAVCLFIYGCIKIYSSK